MRIFSWRMLLPVLAAFTLLFAACGEDEEASPTPTDGDGTPTATATPTADGTATPAPSGDADADQVLRVNLSAEPDTLDPQRATDTVSISVLRQMYSTLLRLDQNQELQPWIATEVPTVENGGISEDGLTYTFTLRDDAVWSDGTPLVAQHFVDGAKRLFEPGSGNYYVDFYRVLAAGGKNVELQQALAEEADEDTIATLEQEVVDNLEVTAPDDHTVVYQLNSRSPVFLLLATMWPLFPARADIIDQHGDQWTEAGNHVSNGPFTLDAWQHNEGITLTKNDEYFDAENVALQTIEMDMIEDSAVAFLAYENDELDIVSLGPAELVQVREDQELRDQFQSYAALITIGIYFNLDYEPFQDINVRQALAGSFDRTEYAEVVREGAVLPAYSWVPPGMPGHDPEAGLQYQDAVEQSQQLMSEAGFDDGNPLSLEILNSESNVAALTAEWLKEQWETNLPVEVSINTLETSTYFSERNAGNYQVVTGGWGADYPDPQNWLPLFKTGGLLNSGNFSSAEFDQLIEQADQELDNERRIEIYVEAQRVMMDEMPFAPLYFGRHNILVKPWVQGLVPSPMESTLPGDLFYDQVSISGRS